MSQEDSLPAMHKGRYVSGSKRKEKVYFPQVEDNFEITRL